jgi:hypothetical protein
MNPVLVIVLGWLCLGLEKGVAAQVVVRLGGVAGAPSFVIPLVVVIALSASPAAALWSCLGLGLALDLITPLSSPDGNELWVAGPHALGFLVAGQFVLLVRGLVIRRNPLTVLALSILAMGLAQIVVTAIFTARHFMGDQIPWEPGAQLVSRLLSALLTGGSGLVMSLVLLPLAPGLGMHGSHSRQWVRR